MVSEFSFSVSGLVPLLAGAFIKDYKMMICVLVAASCLALMVFGGVGAILGKTHVGRSCCRILLGGWMSMAITYGLTMLIGYIGEKM